jgi:hypothetical protein
MYFYNGFGGVSTIESQVSNADDLDQMMADYRELFLFPFQPEQGAEIKSTLSKMWDINNKAELETTLNRLLNEKNDKNPHKAWDYARVVNNACMGYAAGYLTKIEGTSYVEKALVNTQREFKDWDEYLKDYNEGRNIWDPKATDKSEFDKVTKDMLSNPKGLYNNLKLK